MSKMYACLLLALLAPVVALAQSTTSVRGHITDASGAVVPHASVKLTQVSTGATREGTSSAEGIYEFPQLQPGTYTLSVSAPGFSAAEQRNIELLVSVASTLDVNLAVD